MGLLFLKKAWPRILFFLICCTVTSFAKDYDDILKNVPECERHLLPRTLLLIKLTRANMTGPLGFAYVPTLITGDFVSKSFPVGLLFEPLTEFEYGLVISAMNKAHKAYQIKIEAPNGNPNIPDPKRVFTIGRDRIDRILLLNFQIMMVKLAAMAQAFGENPSGTQIGWTTGGQELIPIIDHFFVYNVNPEKLDRIRTIGKEVVGFVQSQTIIDEFRLYRERIKEQVMRADIPVQSVLMDGKRRLEYPNQLHDLVEHENADITRWFVDFYLRNFVSRYTDETDRRIAKAFLMLEN